MPVRKKGKRNQPESLPSARLQGYMAATKVDTVLIGQVANFLQLKSLASDRRADVLHPSEMASKEWCPRASWHRMAGHPVVTSPPLPGLRLSLIFEVGNNIHTKWQGWLQEMGVLYGDWSCLVCDQEEPNTWGNTLEICGADVFHHLHIWVYREVSFHDPRLKISGHGDGLFCMTDQKNRLLEVKSVGPGTMRTLGLLHEEDSDDASADKFSRITHVAGDHFRQVQIYLELSQRDPEVPSLDEAVVVYEHKADQQVREFVIQRDPTWVAYHFDVAEDIVFALRNPRRTIACPHGGCAACHAYEGTTG